MATETFWVIRTHYELTSGEVSSTFETTPDAYLGIGRVHDITRGFCDSSACWDIVSTSDASMACYSLDSDICAELGYVCVSVTMRSFGW
jgi:hypothetical protein